MRGGRSRGSGRRRWIAGSIAWTRAGGGCRRGERRRRPVGARRSARTLVEFQYNEEEVASRDGRRKSTRARREERYRRHRDAAARSETRSNRAGRRRNGRAEAQLGNDAENVSFMYDEKVTCVTRHLLSCSVHGPSTSATPPPPPPQRDAPRRPRPVPSPRPRRGPALEPSLLALESCSRPRARPQPC